MIKNIIFDLGNVILEVNPEKVGEFLRETGVQEVEELHTHLSVNGFYHRLETGHITPGQFRDEVRKFIPFDVTDQVIDTAWNKMLGGIPPERIRLLEDLRRRYRLFLLSNTNEIHYHSYSAYIREAYGYSQLEDLFEKSYFSHLMGLKKPDPEIFRQVIADSGIVAEETLFIDDYPENVESSTSTGIIGFHLNNGHDITRLFDENLEFIGFRQ